MTACHIQSLTAYRILNDFPQKFDLFLLSVCWNSKQSVLVTLQASSFSLTFSLYGGDGLRTWVT